MSQPSIPTQQKSCAYPHWSVSQDCSGSAPSQWDALPQADAIVVAVAHQAVLCRPTMDFVAKLELNGCVSDVKARFDAALNVAGFKV